MPEMRLLIGKMWQPSSFSIKTPLGWLVPTKISFVSSPHRTMLYDTAPLLGINRNSFDFKASRDDLVESLEAAIAKQAQRIKRLVFIVWLLEAQWPQLNNCRPYIAAWKSLVILILRKTKKRHDIALQDVPLCLKLHVILILRKTTKNIASNSNSEKAIAAFFNTVVHEGKMSVYIEWPYLHLRSFKSYTLCSFEVRGTDIPCVGKPHQTFPNSGRVPRRAS